MICIHIVRLEHQGTVSESNYPHFRTKRRKGNILKTDRTVQYEPVSVFELRATRLRSEERQMKSKEKEIHLCGGVEKGGWRGLPPGTGGV